MPDSDRPAWYTDAFPELRAGPPWVMQEMIEAETSLATAMDSLWDTASGISSRIRAAAGDHLPIVVTGCGTSEHGAMAIGEQIDNALGRHGEVEVRQAFEAALQPRSGGLCIGVSHEGGTRATNLALEAAGNAGATTILITARPDSEGGRVADELLVTPMIDRSWCHTVAYMSAILAGSMLAGALSGRRPDARAIDAYLARAHDLAPAIDTLADGLRGSRLLLVCGSGADRTGARELALKIEEGVRMPAVMRDLETLLHGHLVAYGSETGLVLLATDPYGGDRRNRRVELAARAVERLGIRVAAIVSSEVDAAIAPDVTPAGRVVLPDAPNVEPITAALAGSAMILQLLTLSLAQRAGTRPDLIRREEQPYREAAAIAEGTGDW